jgi:hypothetical protein
LLDREGLGSASGSAALGMLADDALLAVVRYLGERDLTDRDRKALTTASAVLGTIGELGERRVEPTSGLRAMASVGVLDETFQAITDASTDKGGDDFVAALTELQSAISKVLEGDATPDTARRLRVFFDRLGSITLARSEEVARPGREQRVKWIREALS